MAIKADQLPKERLFRIWLGIETSRTRTLS
jgi:hypothetical protein